MKKLMTLSAIMTGLSIGAAAQQNDFFDIKKHLQEKHKKKNIPSQKLQLITPGASISNFFISASPLSSTGNFSHYSYKGDPVFILGVDNMPCVALGMKIVKAMPNAFNQLPDKSLPKSGTPGAIPNPDSPVTK